MRRNQRVQPQTHHRGRLTAPREPTISGGLRTVHGWSMLWNVAGQSSRALQTNQSPLGATTPGGFFSHPPTPPGRGTEPLPRTTSLERQQAHPTTPCPFCQSQRNRADARRAGPAPRPGSYARPGGSRTPRQGAGAVHVRPGESGLPPVMSFPATCPHAPPPSTDARSPFCSPSRLTRKGSKTLCLDRHQQKSGPPLAEGK